MPELPEVETTRRGIKPHVHKQKIKAVVIRQPALRWRVPTRLAENACGQTVESVRRRGKYLLLGLQNGTIIMHLGMSGRFIIDLPDQPTSKPGVFVHQPNTTLGSVGQQKHDHVVFHTEDGATVNYNDPRRFGFMVMVKSH